MGYIMISIAFIISHRPDNRYIKRINVLKEKFDLNLLFWNKADETINPVIDGVSITEVHIPANQTNPLKRVPETIRFINKAYKALAEIAPDIVYVGNLDMLYIARKYKKRRNTNAKIIYEIADLHRLIIDEQKSVKKLFSNNLKRRENKYIRDVDILVLTSMKFYDVYYNKMISKSKVVFLPNMPEEKTFGGYIPKKRDGQTFTVGFIGWIRYKNQLRMLIDAAGKVGCNVLFAGTDGEGTEFEEYCKQFSYVQFLGSFKYEEKIRDLYDMIDCVYAVYDADWANVRVALPNKLYEAIDCEKPIIVAKNTYLGELVKEYGIGQEVNHTSVNELEEVLLKLMNDKEYYDKLVDNCRVAKRNATLTKYNKGLLDKISSFEELA